MKKKYIVLLSLIILLGIGWFVFNTSLVKSANNITLSDTKLSDIDDGLYTGEYILMPVKVSAQVEVKNHKIENIIILEHENGLGKKAEVITESIISKQNLDVDIITGATVSSKVIIKAVDNALHK